MSTRVPEPSRSLQVLAGVVTLVLTVVQIAALDSYAQHRTLGRGMPVVELERVLVTGHRTMSGLAGERFVARSEAEAVSC
jgi:hypothetical protein